MRVQARLMHTIAVQSAMEGALESFREYLCRCIFLVWRGDHRNSKLEMANAKMKLELDDLRHETSHSMLKHEAVNRSERVAMQEEIKNLHEGLADARAGGDKRYEALNKLYMKLGKERKALEEEREQLTKKVKFIEK
eukprot:gene2942-7477_t